MRRNLARMSTSKMERDVKYSFPGGVTDANYTEDNDDDEVSSLLTIVVMAIFIY